MKLLLGILFLIGSKAFAHQQCHSYLNSNIASNLISTSNTLEGGELLKRFEKALLDTISLQLEKPSLEEIKRLKAPSKLMTVLKRMVSQQYGSMEFILWTAIEKKIFNKPETETYDFVKSTETIFNTYIQEFGSVKTFQLYTVIAQGKMGMVEAKQQVALQLKKFEFLYSQVLGEKLNLFEESGWLKLFEISDISQLTLKLQEGANLNRELNSRIKEILNTKPSPNSIFNKMVYDFFGPEGVGFKNDGRGFLVRNVTKQGVEELIKELRLKPQVEEKYLADLEVMINLQTSAPHQVQFAYSLILFKAYLEKNPHVPGFTTVDPKERFFAPQYYLYIKNTLTHQKRIRILEDEKYSRYINLSDALNAKHKELEERIADLKERYPKYLTEIQKIEKELSEVPEIRDFQNDLTLVEHRLNQVEIQRDLLTEKILETVTKESIKSFEDLNLRWERILPGKTYELKGLDYTSVLFTKDVVEHFSHNALTGERFLAALSKSYVAIKNASGLRKLSGIHHDFRDIKVIRHGSKIRIVGRLIDKTIHFFYVYEADRPYDNKAMNQIVDHYKPN